MMVRSMLGLSLAAVLMTPAQAGQPPQTIAAAVAAADRPAEDKARDAQRKPAALLAFAGVKPGWKVADLLPGGGYFTRIFAKAVGPRGHVYAWVPGEIVAANPKAADKPKALAAEPAYANVSVVTPTGPDPALANTLDLAWTAQNWHDIYGRFGAEGAKRFDQAVLAALKPGGLYVVIDHVANAGDTEAPNKQHRIDPALVKAQVLAAGFEWVGESDVLRNPADAHDKGVFDPSIRGNTDQFVYKFRKPRG
jgi:predicted methyltransferase